MEVVMLPFSAHPTFYTLRNDKPRDVLLLSSLKNNSFARSNQEVTRLKKCTGLKNSATQ